VVIDTLNPSLVITDDEPGVANIAGGDVTFTFTFGEAVTGFVVDDVTVTGGTKGTFTAVNGTAYTLVVTPAANSTANIAVDVVAGVATDAAGNPNTAAQAVQAVDTASPTVAITDDEPGVANIAGGDVTFRFTFSEAVTGFLADDVTVTGGTKGTFTALSGTVYTLAVTPAANSTANITVDVAEGVANDAAGNPNTAAAQAVQAVDTTAPVVVITDDEPGVANIAGGDVTFTFTFSEAVTGFVAGDVSVTGGTKGTFTAVSGTVYTLVVTPAANSTANITVNVAGAAAKDAAGNGNWAASAVQAVDTVAPTVTVAIVDAALNDGDSSSLVTFEFNEAVTGFTLSGVTAVGGTLSSFSGSGASYSATFTATDGWTGTGSVTVGLGSYTDAAGNLGGAGSDTVVIDTLNPSLVITDDEPGVANIAGGNVTFTFTFSEAVTGFVMGDVTVTGGTKGAFTAVSGTVYTLVVTPAANSTANIAVDVAEGVANDAAGNPNTAAAQALQAVDTTAPGVAITDDEPGVANIAGADVTFTFTFSEAVTGFVAGDVTVTGGTKGAFTAVSGTVYTLVVTPAASSTANITVDVAAGAANDAAGNPNTAAAQAVQAVDTVSPTVLITDDEPGVANIAGGDVTFTFTFSEVVTGFVTGGVSVTGGTKGTLTAVSGTVYTLVVTPAANSTADIAVDVAEGAAADAAGNPNTKASAVQAVDTVAPTVTVAIVDAALNDGDNSSLVTFEFNEAVTGFTPSGVTTAGGTLSSFSGSGASYSATFTATDGWTGTGSVTVGAGSYTDAAGNLGAAGSDTVAIDTLTPSLTITDDEPGVANIAGGDVTFTFTFSEAVTGFVAGDVTVTGGTQGAFTAVSGTVYTLVVTPAANSTANIVVDVAAGVATDVGNNPNTAAATTQAVDTAAPVPVISGPAGPTKTDPFAVTIAFGEPVTGFVLGGLTVTGGTATGLTDTGGGTFTATIDATADGPVTVQVSAGRAWDLAGNANEASNVFSVTVDTTAPQAPVITRITDDTGTSSSDGLTSDQTLVLWGTAEAGSTVALLRDGSGIGATTADAGGYWSFDYTGTVLPVGTYYFTAIATDAAGNSSIASAAFRVMIAFWQNPRHPCDVNGDGQITPLDALILINNINAYGGSRWLPVPPTAAESPPPFLDPSGDGKITPLDVLIVINYINAHGSGPIPEGEAVARAGTGVGPAQGATAVGVGEGEPAVDKMFASGLSAVNPRPRRPGWDAAGWESTGTASRELDEAIAAIASGVADGWAC
jgi:hypothetical protein